MVPEYRSENGILLPVRDDPAATSRTAGQIILIKTALKNTYKNRPTFSGRFVWLFLTLMTIFIMFANAP
jgi:hypothetical protein